MTATPDTSLSPLTEDSGTLRLAADAAGRLTFSFEESFTRPRREVAKVALLPDDWHRGGREPLYRVWRGCRPRGREGPLPAGGGESLSAASDVRLDFTLLLPGRQGRELPRTLGHVHRPEPGGGAHFGELYQVLAGEAMFVLVAHRPGRAAVAAFHAGPGDLVVIPPAYGHFTVNVADTPLLCANLVSRRCLADYATFAGGAVRVWVVADGEQARPIVGPTGAASVSVSVIERDHPHPWVRRRHDYLWEVLAADPPWVLRHLYHEPRTVAV